MKKLKVGNSSYNNWLLFSGSKKMVYTIFLFFLQSIEFAGQFQEITYNGSFSLNLQDPTNSENFFTRPLDSIDGWRTINFSDDIERFPTNTAVFYHSYVYNLSYAEAIIGFENMVCKLKGRLVKGCEYNLSVRYKITEDAIVPNFLKVCAFGQSELDSIHQKIKKQLKEVGEFRISKGAKKDWVEAKLSFYASGDEEYLLFGFARYNYLIPGQIMITSVSLRASVATCEDVLIPINQDVTLNQSTDFTEGLYRTNYTFDYFQNDSIPYNGIDSICNELRKLDKSREIYIQIITQADAIGSEDNNQILSDKRLFYLENVLRKCLPKEINIQFDLKSIGESNAKSGAPSYRRSEVYIEIR